MVRFARTFSRLLVNAVFHVSVAVELVQPARDLAFSHSAASSSALRPPSFVYASSS
jgi:hypothetical protein